MPCIQSPLYVDPSAQVYTPGNQQRAPRKHSQQQARFVHRNPARRPHPTSTNLRIPVQYILLRTAWGAIAGARLLGAGGSTGRNLGHADGHPASRPKTRRHLKASRSSALGHVRQSALPAVYLLLSLVHTCCKKCSWASLERRISGSQLLTFPPLHSLAQHGRVAQGLDLSLCRARSDLAWSRPEVT